MSQDITPHHNDSELDVESVLRSIGKWFFLKHFEIIYTWGGSKDALIATILETPCGKGYSGTNTSITGALRLKDTGAMAEALDIIRRSQRVIHDHPETQEMIESILSQHPELKFQDGTCI